MFIHNKIITKIDSIHLNYFKNSYKYVKILNITVLLIFSACLFYKEGSEFMREVNKNFKRESIIRILLAIIGIVSFAFSSQFGWGFILGGIISKENINLKIKEGWFLLTFISVTMMVVLYFLLDPKAVLGYVLSTISYFFLRKVFNFYKNNDE